MARRKQGEGGVSDLTEEKKVIGAQNNEFYFNRVELECLLGP